MNKERLLKLAEVLENFKEERKNLKNHVEKFDLGLWHCGSDACAVGTAMLHPWFNARGLKAEIRYSFAEIDDPDFMPTYKGKKEWYAVQSFFGIDAFDAYYLFSWGEYTGINTKPTTVAKRIRKFVADGGQK